MDDALEGNRQTQSLEDRIDSLFDALASLYEAGYWVLDTPYVDHEYQTGLWQMAKESLENEEGCRRPRS